MKKTTLKYVFILLTLVIGFSADLLTKNWAVNTLKNQSSLSIINGYLECSYTENRGMIFGIYNKEKPNPIQFVLKYLTIFGTVLLGFYMWYCRKEPLSFLVPLAVILSGAIGNSIDKIRYGFVVDFIHIHLGDILNWPYLFNVADVFICVGCGGMVLQVLFGKRRVH